MSSGRFAVEAAFKGRDSFSAVVWKGTSAGPTMGIARRCRGSLTDGQLEKIRRAGPAVHGWRPVRRS